MDSMSPARLRLLEAMVDAIWESSYATSSVERICERADVRKGSFYHFFRSKTALAVAALEHLWETRSLPALTEVFTSERTPRERIEKLIEYWHQRTIETLEEKGRVLGCPYFNVGAETAAAEPELAAKAREILDRYQDQFEATLREGKELGEFSIDDPAETAACIFSMMEGCSTQARIHNDPERVHHLTDPIGRLIGAELNPAAAAIPTES